MKTTANNNKLKQNIVNGYVSTVNKHEYQSGRNFN